VLLHNRSNNGTSDLLQLLTMWDVYKSFSLHEDLSFYSRDLHWHRHANSLCLLDIFRIFVSLFFLFVVSSKDAEIGRNV